MNQDTGIHRHYQWRRLTLGARAGCFVAYMYLVGTLASLGPYALVTVSYMSHGLGLGNPQDWEQCVGAVGVVCLWTTATVLGVKPVAVPLLPTAWIEGMLCTSTCR